MAVNRDLSERGDMGCVAEKRLGKCYMLSGRDAMLICIQDSAQPAELPQ